MNLSRFEEGLIHCWRTRYPAAGWRALLQSPPAEVLLGSQPRRVALDGQLRLLPVLAMFLKLSGHETNFAHDGRHESSPGIPKWQDVTVVNGLSIRR